MRILPLIIAFSFPLLLTAQMELGFRMGMNMAEADLQRFNDGPFDLSKMKGINAAAYINFRLGSAFAVQPEIGFSQKGFQATWNGADSSSTISTDYLEMPVLLELGIPLGKYIRFYGNAGPNVSYLLQAQEAFYTSTSGETQITNFDMEKESINRVDVGINFGGGISVKIDRWKFLLDTRYNMGLLELMETETASDFIEKAKHRVTNVGISVSYAAFQGRKQPRIPVREH